MQVSHKALVRGTELLQTTRTSSNDSQFIYLNCAILGYDTMQSQTVP